MKPTFRTFRTWFLRNKALATLEIVAFLLIGYAGMSGHPPASAQVNQEVAIEMMHDKDHLETLDGKQKDLQDSINRTWQRMNAQDTRMNDQDKTINEIKVAQAGNSGSRTWIDGSFGTILVAILGLQVKNTKKSGDDE